MPISKLSPSPIGSVAAVVFAIVVAAVVATVVSAVVVVAAVVVSTSPPSPIIIVTGTDVVVYAWLSWSLTSFSANSTVYVPSFVPLGTVTLNLRRGKASDLPPLNSFMFVVAPTAESQTSSHS